MKRKRKKQIYDTSNPNDAVDVGVLKTYGIKLDRRYSRDEMNALMALPPSRAQTLRGQFTLGVVHREKLKGSEEREVESIAVTLSTLPDCFHFLPGYLQEAVNDYQTIWNEARPSETVSLSPRMSGGGASQELYDHGALEAWSRVRRQMSGKEAKTIEQFLSADVRGALMSVGQSFLVRSGAGKLAEYFEQNTPIR